MYLNLHLKRILVGTVLSLILTVPALGQTRVGTVDLSKVFEKYWKREQAEAELKKHGADLEKEFETFKTEYDKLAAAYSKLLEAANDQEVTSAEREKHKQAA